MFSIIHKDMTRLDYPNLCIYSDYRSFALSCKWNPQCYISSSGTWFSLTTKWVAYC